MKDTVKCNNCLWSGIEDELQTFEDTSETSENTDRQFFKGCPNCETDSYLTDI
jgi:Zn finger protein HypA/HybF involved in hydrogenase expression